MAAPAGYGVDSGTPGRWAAIGATARCASFSRNAAAAVAASRAKAMPLPQLRPPVPWSVVAARVQARAPSSCPPGETAWASLPPPPVLPLLPPRRSLLPPRSSHSCRSAASLARPSRIASRECERNMRERHATRASCTRAGTGALDALASMWVTPDQLSENGLCRASHCSRFDKEARSRARLQPSVSLLSRKSIDTSIVHAAIPAQLSRMLCRTSSTLKSTKEPIHGDSACSRLPAACSSVASDAPLVGTVPALIKLRRTTAAWFELGSRLLDMPWPVGTRRCARKEVGAENY